MFYEAWETVSQSMYVYTHRPNQSVLLTVVRMENALQSAEFEEGPKSLFVCVCVQNSCSGVHRFFFFFLTPWIDSRSRTSLHGEFFPVFMRPVILVSAGGDSQLFY